MDAQHELPPNDLSVLRWHCGLGPTATDCMVGIAARMLATNFVAALRHNSLTAPLVIDGALNGEQFLADVQQQLAPTLWAGDLVVMDELPAHKVADIREAITAVRATLVYQPPYSLT